MTSSFYNGVSGVKTHQFGMDVWSHNFANINGVGFRAKRPEFANIFSQSVVHTSLNPVTSQSGLGSTGQTTAMIERVGGYMEGYGSCDMAILGEGWFGTKSYDGNTYYTRKGDFDIDQDGNLVTTNGNFVLGTMANFNGDLVSSNDIINLANVQSQEAIKVPSKLFLPAQATSKVSIKANLNPEIKKDYIDIKVTSDKFNYLIDQNSKLTINGDANGVEGLFEAKENDMVLLNIKDANGSLKRINTRLKSDLTWSINEADLSGLDTSKPLNIDVKIRAFQEIKNEFFASTQIYTSTNEKHTLSIDFTKRIPFASQGNVWDAVAYIQDEYGNEVNRKRGVLRFNDKGALSSNTLNEITNGDTNLKLNLGSIFHEEIPNSGFDGLTAIASGAYGVGDIAKDGRAKGSLKQYVADDEGQIQAYFDNGYNVPVAKVAIYHFQNDQGLSSEGGTFFVETNNSGKPLFYKDKNGNFSNLSSVKASKLEMSNVDLGTAITEIIVMQKAFDASAKSITTSDQLLQNAINMKR